MIQYQNRTRKRNQALPRSQSIQLSSHVVPHPLCARIAGRAYATLATTRSVSIAFIWFAGVTGAVLMTHFARNMRVYES